MTTQIRYGKTCHVHALGRNRYIQTTGLDILATGGELILYPINSRGESSNSCCIPVPMTAAPAVADALIKAATPTLHDQLGFWPGLRDVNKASFIDDLAMRAALANFVAVYRSGGECEIGDDADETYDDRMAAAYALAREALGERDK